MASIFSQALSPFWQGRTPRRAYWLGGVLLFLMGVALQSFLDGLLQVTMYESTWDFVSGVGAFAAFVLTWLSLMLVVRRFHDIGRSGLWALVVLIPIVGGLTCFILGFLSSAQGTNAYGRNPYDQTMDPDSENRLYVQTIDALERLSKLRDAGTITESQFQEQKAQILAQSRSTMS